VRVAGAAGQEVRERDLRSRASSSPFCASGINEPNGLLKLDDSMHAATGSVSSSRASASTLTPRVGSVGQLQGLQAEHLERVEKPEVGGRFEPMGPRQRCLRHGAAERHERRVGRVLQQGCDGSADGHGRRLRTQARRERQRERSPLRGSDVEARLWPRDQNAAVFQRVIGLKHRGDADALLPADGTHGRQAHAGRKRAVVDHADDEVRELLVTIGRGRLGGVAGDAAFPCST